MFLIARLPTPQKGILMFSRILLGHVVVIFLLAGCTATTKDSYFLKQVSASSSKAASDMEGLSIDAKQRLIWMPIKSSKDGTKRRLLCAEPSPDVMAALSSSFTAAAKSSIASKGDIGVNLQASLTESLTNIGKRTATVQILRDSLYRACEAHANGMLDEFGYALLLSKIDNLIVQLVSIEALERIFETKAQTQNQQATTTPARPNDNNTEAQISFSEAIIGVNQASHSGSTIAGACMMYFSQREKTVSAGHLVGTDKSTPAIAHFCGEFLNAHLLKLKKPEQ